MKKRLSRFLKQQKININLEKHNNERKEMKASWKQEESIFIYYIRLRDVAHVIWN